MENEILVSFFTEQCSVILKNRGGVKENDTKSIHKLRVAIKKVRAFSVFVSDLSSGGLQISEMMEPLKKIFRKSGKVRDIQVQRGLLLKYEKKLNRTYPKFNRYLAEREKSYQPKLSRLIKSTNFKELIAVEQSIISFLKLFKLNNPLESCEEITNTKLLRLSEYKRAGFDDDSLHEFRKTFKELMFIYRINEVLFPELISKFDLREMDSFAEKLGKWHDRSVMLSFIQEYRAKYNKTNALKALYELVFKDYSDFMNNLDAEMLQARIEL